jgi:hypothetical protein
VSGRVLAVAAGALTTAGLAALLWRMLRFAFRLERALPTLLNIAGQFESNGGSTLRDKIEQLHTQANEQGVEARLAVRIAEDGRLIAQTNAAIVNELTATQGEDVRHIKDYLHDKLHDLANAMTRADLQTRLTDRRTQRIEERLDNLLPYVVRHRDTDPPENP